MTELSSVGTESDPEPAERPTPATLLVVDDSATSRALLLEMASDLSGIAEVLEADSGERALEIAAALRPDVVLMDISMPGMSGIEATAELQRISPDSRVIVVSSSLDPGDVRQALEAGAAGYTVKSSDRAELRNAVAAAVRGRGVLSSEVVRPVVGHYVELLTRTSRQLQAAIESLGAAVEAKDRVTREHLDRVSKLGVALAGAVDPELAADREFLFGCLLHDVGKIGIPESVLGKPGPLDDGEWAHMREHPEIGLHVIEPLGLGDVAQAIVLHHHERWDGSGYPQGLAGDRIPLAARIFSVCDALDAMTSRRPYRDPLPVDEAILRITDASGTQFDPVVVETLVEEVRAGRIVLAVPPTDG